MFYLSKTVGYLKTLTDDEVNDFALNEANKKQLEKLMNRFINFLATPDKA